MPSSNRFGLSLRDALQSYTAPAEWEEWERLKKSVDGLVVVRGAGRAENRLAAAHKRHWDRMVRAFQEKLASGELVATAIETPMRADSGRIKVSTALWPVLDLDFRNSMARGDGVTFRDVLVATAEETAAKYRPSDYGRAPQKGSGELWPGRPSFPKREIEKELKRRAEAGLLFATLAEEARHLSGWACARAEELEWSHGHPSPKTVENRIRQLYWELKRKSHP